MSFALDRYDPVAFHVHPELMRAAEAPTAVLAPSPSGTPVAAPQPPPAPSPPVARAAAEPIAAYVVGMGATASLQAGLADLLDAAGARRDVRVSVGVAAGTAVTWVLRDQVPYGVRALPRYPAETGPADAGAVLTGVAAAVTDDAAGAPGRRQLVVLLWDRPPTAVPPLPAMRPALVLHAVDAVLDLPPSAATGQWVLARTRPGPRPSLLAHVGRLLDRWEDFARPPRGLVLARL